MDKPWYQSVTIISALVFSAVSSLEASGVIPAGTAQNVADLIKVLSGFGTVFGMRRAISK